MIPAEWGPLAARIDAWWSQPSFDEIRSTAYFELLQDYEFAQVEEAFRQLLSEGREFLPSLSVVLAKLEENGDAGLRFEAMWKAVTASLYQENPERFLQTEHPLYLLFFREQGGIQVLSRVDANNSYRMHQLRGAWDELTAEYRDQERQHRVRKALHARPLVPLAAGAKRQEGLRKLPAAAAVGIPTAEPK